MGPILDHPYFVRAVGDALSSVESADLAVRGLRVHASVAAGPSEWSTVLDCTRRVPSLELGLSGSGHIFVHVDERALVPLLAAHSFRDLFPYLQDGSIRLQRGLFNALRIVRDPRTARDNTALRAALDAALAAASSPAVR